VMLQSHVEVKNSLDRSTVPAVGNTVIARVIVQAVYHYFLLFVH